MVTQTKKQLMASAALALGLAWQSSAIAEETTSAHPTLANPDILTHLRAGALLDSGAASVSQLRPGAVDEKALDIYTANQVQDRLRAGQTLDSGALSISELRPGTVDQGSLTVYLSMAEEPRETGLTEAGQTMVLLAAMSVAAGTEPVTLQTASGILLRETGIMPRSNRGADGVWEFPRMPDSDERDLLTGEKWRVVENVESQILFLGPDREFGLDDFADLVNPLQHIPLINMAYRAVTGDEMYGAARLIELGMGPVAGISTVFDLALESHAGGGMEDFAMAAMFGPLDIYERNGLLATTASGDAEQVAIVPRRGSTR